MLNTTHFTWAKVSCINQKQGVIKIVPLSNSFRGGKTRRQKINHPHPPSIWSHNRVEESRTMNDASVFQGCLGNSVRVLNVRQPAQRGKWHLLWLYLQTVSAHSSPSRHSKGCKGQPALRPSEQAQSSLRLRLKQPPTIFWEQRKSTVLKSFNCAN